jgi:hypothetical protein
MPNIKNSAIRERNSLIFLGCSEMEAIRLNGDIPLRAMGSCAQKYFHQRQAAFKRGIGWEITFPDWLEIWQASGKWDLRGCGKGRFCMARNGDAGPYKVGNVSIQLCTQNSRDGIKKARATINRKPAGGSFNTGTGRGWTYRCGHKKPYQVVVARKYVGVFATQMAAEDAYRAAAAVHRGQVLK